MKLALECPTSMLNDIQPLADFDWILAHKVLEDKEYRKYYSESKRFKVLDNSVNELLEPVNLNSLNLAAGWVNPNLIVAPDYLGDVRKTREALDETIYMLGKGRVLPVVQGKDLGEVLDLLKTLLSLGLERVAVPYDILSSREDSSVMMAGNRLKVVNSIIGKVPIRFEIHLLGMTTIEELENHNRGWVKSIDTGVPVMMGLKGYRLDVDRLENKKRPTMELMEGITSLDPDFREMMVYRNIAYLRKILND